MKNQTSSNASRTGTNAIDLLKSDHRMVEQLFAQIESSQDSDEVAQLVMELSTALSVHARIEEEVFYPSVRAAVAKASDLLDEAAVEHGSLKHFLVDISTSSDDSPYYRARLKVLEEYVKHHVKEEEEELMPMAESAGIDLEALGELLDERRTTLMAAMQPGTKGFRRSPARDNEGARTRQ